MCAKEARQNDQTREAGRHGRDQGSAQGIPEIGEHQGDGEDTELREGNRAALCVRIPVNLNAHSGPK